MTHEESLKIIQKNTERNLKAIEETLKEIEKSAPSLNEEEISFVRARRSYLTPAQQDTFAEFLTDDEVTYAELKEMAKELGIKTNGVKKEDLKRLVEEAQS